jgi:predicted nucleic acid-binding Zn ribbon protein
MTRRQRAERDQLGPFASLRCQEDLDRESQRKGFRIIIAVLIVACGIVGVLM